MSDHDLGKDNHILGFFENLGKFNENGGTILIVDSNNRERERARTILSKEGFEVYTASDAIQAQNMLLQSSDEIDLCLIDPEIHGKPSGQIISEILHIYPNVKIAVYESRRIYDMAFSCLISSRDIPKLEKPFYPDTITRFVKHIFRKDSRICEI